MSISILFLSTYYISSNNLELSVSNPVNSRASRCNVPGSQSICSIVANKKSPEVFTEMRWMAKDSFVFHSLTSIFILPNPGIKK